MAQLFSHHFCESLLHGNAARIQHFDIVFEQDLIPAFQNIFPIENWIIFVVFRTNFQLYSYRQWLLEDNWFPVGKVFTNSFDVNHKSSTGCLANNFAGIFNLFDNFHDAFAEWIIWENIHFAMPRKFTFSKR